MKKTLHVYGILEEKHWNLKFANYIALAKENMKLGNKKLLVVFMWRMHFTIVSINMFAR